MSITLPRALSITTNPAGWLAAAGAVTAAVTMIVNALNHHGVISTGVIVAAVGAVGALLTRQVVTPVKDPKDGNGNALVAVAPAPPVVASAPVIPAVPEAPRVPTVPTASTP